MSRKSRHILSAPLALLLAMSLLTTMAPPALFATTGNAALETYPGSEVPQLPLDASDQSPASDGQASTSEGQAAPEMVGKLPHIAASTPAAFAPNQLITMADTTPPQITSHSPANGAITGSSLTISASYSDPEPSIGIKPSTAMIHVDNRHQFGSVITDTSITCQKSGLTDGSHKLEAFICDNNYNCTVATWYITVDATAPVISNAQPTGTLNSTSATISASFSDGAGTGIDASSANVALDGVNVNSTCGISTEGVSCASGVLGEGAHEVQIEVFDLAGNRAVKNWGFTVDAAAIAITGQAPADGSWQTSASPAIQAIFHQAGAGIIDTSSITVLLDGIDVSAEAERTRDGMVFRPSPQLAEGQHAVIIALNDDAGHAGRSEWRFAVDTLPPQITNQTPAGAASSQPMISAEIDDDGSGMDPDSLNLAVDGVNTTGAASMSGNLVTYTPPETLSPGPHSVQMAVRDLAGNQQTSTWGFSVPQPPTATRPAATPLVTGQLTLVEYWQSYSSLSGPGGNWIISGFMTFPSTYYLPWYDSGQTAGPLKDELVIRNHGAGAAIVNVLLGGEVKWQGKIGESGSETFQLPDTTGGPLKIICPSGQPLEVIHRVTGGNGVLSETPAVSDTDLESVLLLPWYETRPAGEGSSSLVIANAGTEEAAVDVYVGDPAQPESLKGHYSIGPDSAARTVLPDTSGGPVRIVSTNNQPLLAGLQVTNKDSFSETFATSLSRLGDRFSFEASGSGGGSQSSRLHVGNSNDRDLQEEVRIGDELLRDPDNPDNEFFTIPRNGVQAIDLNLFSGKSVEVTCTDCLFGEGLVVDESSS